MDHLAMTLPIMSVPFTLIAMYVGLWPDLFLDGGSSSAVSEQDRSAAYHPAPEDSVQNTSDLQTKRGGYIWTPQ